MKKAKKYEVFGVVQGVGFRYFTINAANKLGLSGYVKNLYNGNVEVYAIGEESRLEDLRKYLKKGPMHSRVDRVVEEDASIDDSYTTFKVEF